MDRGGSTVTLGGPMSMAGPQVSTVAGGGKGNKNLARVMMTAGGLTSIQGRRGAAFLVSNPRGPESIDTGS